MDSPLSPGRNPALLEHRVPASDCDRIKVCCLSHQVCGNLLKQPQQRTQLTSNTTAWASSLRSAQGRLPSTVPSWWFTIAYTFPMAKIYFYLSPNWSFVEILLLYVRYDFDCLERYRDGTYVQGHFCHLNYWTFSIPPAFIQSWCFCPSNNMGASW